MANTYLIREENMERLEKKLATIRKKCEASHCSFNYTIIGDHFETYTNEYNEEVTVRYKEVEVDGVAKYNNWHFVATIDHHDEGNVIRAYDTELVVPDKYKTCGPTCEHCQKIRSRKDTYLIYNDETHEFKQVGKSCLQEFTNGLSADNIAFFCSIYEKLEEGHEYSGPSSNRYIEVESILRYAFECFKHWGYQKSASSFYEEEVPVGYRSTRDRVTDYYYINRLFGKEREQCREEMNSVGFNPDSEYAVESTKAALEWIRNEKDLSSEYIRNLHIICSDEYTDYRSLGILVSLTVSYARHIEQIAAYEEKEKVEKEEKATSNYVGEIKDKLEITTTNFQLVSSWSTIYGMTYLYKWADESGNVFIWYASNPVENEDRVVSVKGTIKDHSEYNGLKQNVMTRCKVTCKPEDPEEGFEPASSDVQEALDMFFEAVNG